MDSRADKYIQIIISNNFFFITGIMMNGNEKSIDFFFIGLHFIYHIYIIRTKLSYLFVIKLFNEKDKRVM